MMKKIAIMLTSALTALLLLSACTVAPATEAATEAPATIEATEAPATEAATEAPAAETDGGDLSFSFTTLTGGTLDQSIFSNNKLIMVNYWATWCGPCVSEIPDLVKISKDYADKGFALIGVNVDNSDEDGVKQFIADQGITYPVIFADGFFLDEIQGYQYIPTTLFYDSTGKQVGQAVVGSNSYSDWSGLIDTLLEQVG